LVARALDRALAPSSRQQTADPIGAISQGRDREWPQIPGQRGLPGASMLGLCECGLDLFEAELELIEIELLEAAAGPVMLERLNYRLKALDLIFVCTPVP
jgi:hypothetical protein